MIVAKHSIATSPLRKAITNAYRQDENERVAYLIEAATLPADALQRIAKTARELVVKVREKRTQQGGLDAFLNQYDLSSEEGIALMCLAEALLRIPDKETMDNLIRDKISTANWAAHAGQSHSFFVNAATWGLIITGRLLSKNETGAKQLQGVLQRFIERSSEPVIRTVLMQAMRVLGKQFVMGQDIEEALKRARDGEEKGYRYSYDMLGEAARTSLDAERYFNAYSDAIKAIGEVAQGRGAIESPGISVKLSALHPRYEFAQFDSVMEVVVPRLRDLAIQAKNVNIGLTVDAEEAERLDLSLDIIAAVFCDPALKDWEGFGLAVQSYQKRAMPLIDWLADLARSQNKRWMVRLIKGAYWDSEIKQTQVRGLEEYPVFTRKAATDVSFLACAKKILANPTAFYPQFATHNAYTVAAVLEMAGERRDFEFQCLHGMGYTLYDQIVGPEKLDRPCRVYAPVGGHEDLLAYLVRRLLENGANTSFVNRILDETIPVEEIIADPVARVRQLENKRHPKIPLPKDLYGADRKNSMGIDLTHFDELQALDEGLSKAMQNTWQATPLIPGSKNSDTATRSVVDPSDPTRIVGYLTEATPEQVEQALVNAEQASKAWSTTPVAERAAALEKAADLLERDRIEFMALAIREAGKTIPDAIAEIREAADFCRYYAMCAKQDMAKPVVLPGPTGEYNHITWHARGVMACISPWNFPLAIFMGQVTAALAAGNAVIAKPADPTPLIAARAVRLLIEAGIPEKAVQLVPGRGRVVGAKLLSDQRVSGVIFTGSTETACTINQTLAARSGPIVPLIAETGGQNAMIVDSSSLPEQVVMDVIASAFGSAGQRCSALRVLFVQNEIAPKLLEMLKGAMAELNIGDPALLKTDVGPVINQDAKATLTAHAERMQQEAKLLYQVPLSADLKGSFFAPVTFEIDNLQRLQREVFGPILHVVRYAARDLDQVIDAINNTGYGLTLGIHSRIDNTVRYIQNRIKVGNAYVNRTMIGAVVGVQPFGGEGLSGTGPKAGGPHYLHRLCTERCLSINTTAAGGNASLMSLIEEPGV